MAGYQAPVPARFYALPDGSQSSVQMIVGPDGEPRPLEVKTDAQLAEWQAIQDARPPTAVESATRLAVSMVRPVTDPGAGDDPTAPGWLAQRKAEAEAEAATVPTPPEPATQEEFSERALAASRLAEALGYVLVHVPVTDALGNPPHLELRDQAGYPGVLGGLPDIEKWLSDLRRDREKRDAEIAVWRSHREQLARETAEAVANLPANRIRVLEAEREADRERLARLEQMLADRERLARADA